MEYVLTGRMLRGENLLRWLLLALPVYFYVVTTWIIRPLSIGNFALAYAVPLSFVTGFILIQVPRWELIAMLQRVKVELALALVMVVLSILSVINSSEPFQIFRILFPSALPILLFFQLVALRTISPEAVARLPRVFLAVGVVFACLPLLLSFASDGVHDYLFQGGHRFMSLFDHENQLSVMVAVLIPLIIGEIAISEKKLGKWLWIALLILFFYTLIRIGSKTALFITLSYAWLFYIIVHLRFQSYLKSVFMVSAVVVMMIFLGMYGLPLASAIDPILGWKIGVVFNEGIENYATIESRRELWSEAWRQGKTHWLIGTGAGETILGLSHAHNLILDYFRGIGVFGALAVTLLCVRIAWRAAAKAFAVLRAKTVSRMDIRILACYASAVVYVTCNQLSNSFGPATISALWIIYLSAVLSEPHPNGSRPSRFT